MKNYLHFIIMFLGIAQGYAQSAGDIDTSFNSFDVGFGYGDGANSHIESIAVQSDGKIIIVGEFTTYNGISRNGIARLNIDGSLDMTFDPGSGADNIINSVVIQPDGKIIIGGYFNSYNNIYTGGLVQLNSDGSIDNTFLDLSDSYDYWAVKTLLIQPDGKILVSGWFSFYEYDYETYEFYSFYKTIIRLNSNGNLDYSFNDNTNTYIENQGYGESINTIALQPDGKILIGGSFSSYGGGNNIARLNSNGSIDNSFQPLFFEGLYFTEVYSIVIQSNEKILVGGGFSSYGDFVSNNIVRLNIDGSVDISFNSETTFNSSIRAICLQPEGKIFIGGWFSVNNNPSSRNRIALLNEDGSIDDSFNGTGIKGAGGTNSVDTIVLHPDGKILVGGRFRKFNDNICNYLFRLDIDRNLDIFNLGSGANSFIKTIATQSNGKILIGGAFTSYNGTYNKGIARLDEEGEIDSSFESNQGFTIFADSSIYGGTDAVINTIILQPDEKILVGGRFDYYNGVTRKCIVRLNNNGSLDESFSLDTGIIGGVYDPYINSIAIQPDGKILIGGNFTSFNDVNRGYIARLNIDGSLDETFDSNIGANNIINSIIVQEDGKILIGGNFITYNGVVCNRIARLNINGSLDESFNLGTGVNNVINAMVIQPDGKILVCGNFTAYNGVTCNRIARLNVDGGLDETFNSYTGANGIINTIILQPDNKIIIGGQFSSYQGINSKSIARINHNGSKDQTFSSGYGTDGIYNYDSNIDISRINSVLLHFDNKILIGGQFTSYNGTGRNHIARIHGRECLYETVWNGEEWSNGEPNLSTKAIINGDLIISSSLSACQLDVLSAGSVVIEEGATLIVEGTITNNATPQDFIVQSGANLIQNNDVTNIGEITVQRSKNMKHLDYTLWSSPVAEQGLKAFSPQTLWYRIYDYNAQNDAWSQVFDSISAPDVDFEQGIGYMFRAPNNFITTPYVYNGEFTGVPNNGDVTVEFDNTETYQGLGNPYPSNISIADFWAGNSGTGTLYFWTNTNAWNNTTGDYVGNNWATYNLTGGVSSESADNDATDKKPNGFIPVGQGFMVEAPTLLSVTFTNAMRVSDEGVFFKTMETNKHRLWLNLSNENNMLNQTLIGYLEGATQDFDFGIDTKLFGYSGSALYSLIENTEDNFVIQGRALPFDDNDVVPLGFRANEAGNYTISLADFDGIFAEGQDIFIKDNLTQTQQNLKNENYSFVSEQGIFNNRFEVVYKQSGTLDIINPDLSNSWVVYKKDDAFHIQSQGFEIKKVTVYDMLGRTVYSSEAEGNSHILPYLGANQVLIVKITTTKNEVSSKKVQN